MIKSSTGLRTHLAVTGSIKSAMDGGLIKFYNGIEPATADAAVTGSLLWTVSLGGAGTGLTFDSSAVNSSAVKPSAAVWAGATTAGTPTYWRFVASGDTGGSSTTEKRIQGNCGNFAGADIYLSNPTLVTDASTTAKALDSFAAAVLTY